MSISTTQKPTTRRIVGMVVGIVIIGLGIALFKQSHLGNDSISALNMRLAELLGISLGVQNVATNILFFALEFWFGRKYIGLGTFVNGIGMGFIITFFYDPIAAAFGPAASLPEQLVWVVLAVLVTALGASLYQTADLGIAPYDYLSLGLRDYTHFQYFGCRVFTDAFCALLCWLLGGLVGLGTLICAFCLGPFIQFDVLFTDDLYTRISRNAIETANALKKGLAAKGYRFFMDSPTNQLFVVLENTQLAALEGKAKFGFWEKFDDSHTVVRIATSWATKMEEIEQLIALMALRLMRV